MNIKVDNSHTILVLKIYKSNSIFGKIYFIDLGGKLKI
jgi:hypothetical protein